MENLPKGWILAETEWMVESDGHSKKGSGVVGAYKLKTSSTESKKQAKDSIHF